MGMAFILEKVGVKLLVFKRLKWLTKDSKAVARLAENATLNII